MKILLFTDLHMCPRASIINKWGTKYPRRLENCIETVNWLERKAEENNCDYIISLGDFFDKPDLSSETITACNEIKWSNIMHYHIVGNHDASNSSLIFNATNMLSADRHSIVTDPMVLPLVDCDICFLPYIIECDRKPLNEYFKTLDSDKPKIILSHNDINGIQLGPIVSRTGFSIEEIEANCRWFFNGHLHSRQIVTPRIINLGCCTGKDFGTDAAKHEHGIVIFDTTTMVAEFIENPYAYNFYKIEINTETDLALLDRLKTNAAVSIKCVQNLVEKTRQKIEEIPNIIESRIMLVRHYEDITETSELNLTVDHLTRFIECCKANIENSTILEEELGEICK
jgi:DNA repair exonuclease SbcCD nuclease subunit